MKHYHHATMVKMGPENENACKVKFKVENKNIISDLRLQIYRVLKDGAVFVRSAGKVLFLGAAALTFYY